MHRSLGNRGTIKASWFGKEVTPEKSLGVSDNLTTLERDILRNEKDLQSELKKEKEINEKLSGLTKYQENKKLCLLEELRDCRADITHLKDYLQVLQNRRDMGAKY